MWPFHKSAPLTEAQLRQQRQLLAEMAEAREQFLKEAATCAGGGAHSYFQRVSLGGFIFGMDNLVCSKCGKEK